ncbi:A disintegrin and metalloproteinase with thrombospondin motifs 8 [Brachyhypopomus gauderio]|uniref:A disintegrin and metalloproteinase with thrombospondin motifs 8 n=1 Tax=Brachyhypopomus gauderio TaxID=698409 RepID=UPI004041F945
MCSWLSFVLAGCLFNVCVSRVFEAEEVVPVRVSKGGRYLRVSLTAFGRDFTLNVSPDSSFISPTLKVYRIKAEDVSTTDGQVSTSDPTELHNTANKPARGCFFTGTVGSRKDSVVALSLCHGIWGSFILDGEEFQIEPKRLGSEINDSATDQLHLVKRKTMKKTLIETKKSFGRTEDATSQFSGNGERLSPAGRRHRRFVSAPRFVETLVVADASMARVHGDEIKVYVLTLMSVAAQIFKHSSIKNSLNLVVVKMLIIEEDELGPSVSSNGHLSLRNFCSWQQLFNPASQRHPEHYDTALLLTRQDICVHQSCDTLGVADVGTMCDPRRSCSVIEDNGLQASFTIAHELGHVLSMPHDDSKNCNRHVGHGHQHHIMAPVFAGFNKSSPWSPCSAYFITEFLDSGHGDCLLDAPENALPLPVDSPGLTYSLDHQCQQAFGEVFTSCTNHSAEEVCAQLWCQRSDQAVCTTRNGSLPWADGTPCGPDRTCLSGVCTASDEVMKLKVPVDGGWGEWGAWQGCSRSCGGGVMFSYRECDRPAPHSGGRYCEGQRVQYQSCNTQDCESSHGKSFREEQCEKYNNPNHHDIHGKVKQWIPKYAGVSPRDRCRLFCRARGSSEFKVFQAKVIDGTRCSPDTTSVCVQGQCIKAGCDQQIGSSKKRDKCGVCDGDGLTCRKISGSYNKVIQGYSDVVTIPVGATNIDIKQRSHRAMRHDGNYLAVKRENGEYLLNGNFSVSTVEHDVPVRGAVLKYSGSDTSLERVQSFQGLGEAITVQLLSTAGETSPPKVKYTFFIPKGVSFGKPKDSKAWVHAIHPFGVPRWVLGDWSECSRSCGSGWSRRSVDCRDDAGFYSNTCDKGLRPTDIRACADLPCPVWQTGPWSSGGQRHTPLCTDYTGKVVEEEKCDPTKRPKPLSDECTHQECP